MIFTTGEEEWDAVIRVHLKGHFATTRHATEWWRDQAKAGAAVDGRIVNTSSGAGLMGAVGQGAYAAAKAGIAALTLVEAAEMGRYGVTANAIAPAARTRATSPAACSRWRAACCRSPTAGSTAPPSTAANGGSRPRSARPCATSSRRRRRPHPSTARSEARAPGAARAAASVARVR